MRQHTQQVYFNPRSRERSDDYLTKCVMVFQKFQSTLPREERHTSRKNSDTHMRISIHAPARGATKAKQYNPKVLSISIHAPARGATMLQRAYNPFFRISIHAPARGATGIKLNCNVYTFISIHAPARGATDEQRAKKS